MALWPGKKDQTNARPEPDAPDFDNLDAPEGNQSLHELTDQLGKLEELFEDANRQVAAYLLKRESQTGAAQDARDNGPADDVSEKIIAEKIDALAAKLDKLSGTGPSADARDPKPDAGSHCEEALQAALAPLQAKLDPLQAKLDPLQAQLDPLQAKLDQIETKLQAAADAAASSTQFGTLSETLGHVSNNLNGHHQAIAGTLAGLQQRLDAGVQSLTDLLRPAEPDPSGAGHASNSDWQRAILGSDLAEVPGLDFQRQQLLAGVLQGDPGACSLVGQLLVFRSAMSEKMPPLLKEVGEAFYRWQPKTAPAANPMEDALVAWLTETMQDTGIGNRIELVHPGERFDSTRHSAAARGVEITEVLGWIVLRDNGKVYTKATVSAK